MNSLITQTYTFQNLPLRVIRNEDQRQLKFIQGLLRDIDFEIGSENYGLTKSHLDVTGQELILSFLVSPQEAQNLQCAIHNLHSGKLIQ